MAGINTQIIFQNCDSPMDEIVCIHAQDLPTMQIGDIIEIQPKYPDPSVTMASPKIGFFERIFGNPGTSGCTPESFTFRPNYFCRNCCGGTNQFGTPYWGNIQPQGVCHKNCKSWKFDPPTVPKSGKYVGNIKFPAVTDADQYDIYLTAEEDTKHDTYLETRFQDNSIDINSSKGSNSLRLQKVMYQTLPVTITISNYSPTGSIASIVNTNDTIIVSRSKSEGILIPFETKATFSSGAITIDRQPVDGDILAFVEATVGDPSNIPGENVYPDARSTLETVNGAITSGAIVEIDNDVADRVVIGDKITVTATTDTVNGDFRGGATAITMDSAVATKMAVGDQVTGLSTDGSLNSSVVTVASLDSTNVFSLSTSTPIADGTTLTFSNKVNRNLTTVLSLDPSGEAKQFTMSQAIQFHDNAIISLYPRMNYRWGLDNIDLLAPGMIALADTTNGFTSSKYVGTAGATIKEYLDEIVTFEGEKKEKRIEIVKVKPLDTLGVKPTLTRNGTTKVLSTTQTGNIIFDQQAPLAWATTTAKIFGYGPEKIKLINNYDVEFSDLKAELNTITTTTSADTSGSASTTMAVASVLGIADDTGQTVDGAITESTTVVLDSVGGLFVGQTIYAVSAGTLTGNPIITSIKEGNKTITISSKQTFADGITLTFANSVVSGPGIGAGIIDPYVDSISSLNLTLSVAQALENGQTFTFSGAGNIVTITGKIKINYVGNEDMTLRFDLDRFLTQHS